MLNGFVRLFIFNPPQLYPDFLASGGQGALFEKTAPWTPAKTFY
jgi:hypothetical protein